MAQLKSTNINGGLNVYGVSTTKKMVVDNNAGSSNIELINTVQGSNDRVYIKMKPLAAYDNYWTILADNANNFKLYYNNNGTSDLLKFRIDSNGNLFAVDGSRKVWTEANINPMPKNGGTFTGNVDFSGSANIIASNGNTNGYYVKKTDGTRVPLLRVDSNNECLIGNDMLSTKLYGTTLQYHGYDVWHKGTFNPTRNIDANTLNGNITFRCKNNYGICYLKSDGTEMEGWYVTTNNIFYKSGDITVSGTINSQSDVRNNTTSLNTLHNSVNTIKNDSYKLHSKEIGNSSSYSNLNSIYIPGNYRSRLAANLWSNLPSGVIGAFELCVNSIHGESTSYTTQYLKDYRNNNLYVRTYTDGSWNSWRKFWIEGDILLSAGYNNDLAENFETLDTTIEPGDIVALDCNSNEETYVKATENSKVVVGVCSDTYGFLLGGIKEEDDKKYTPIGLCGRVYVKFIGKANAGDKVVPSNIAGVGRAFRDGDNLDKVIGVLTESDDKTDIRRLHMLIK